MSDAQVLHSLATVGGAVIIYTLGYIAGCAERNK